VLYRLSYRIKIDVILSIKIMIVKFDLIKYIDECMAIRTILLFGLFVSVHLIAKVDFTADQLILSLPNAIKASGNASFIHKDIQVDSGQFLFDTQTQQGVFQDNVIVKALSSQLVGDVIMVNVAQKKVSGNGNIRVKTMRLNATSDDFLIENFERLTLKNNVVVSKNNSQIQSNELVYNLKTNTILSNERVKLIIEQP
jgi:lipopolysaccharide export system protein LptA